MSPEQALQHRFFQHVAPADLEGRDQRSLEAIAASALELASSRGGSGAAVRVINPGPEEGWSTRHTVLQVCVDDMPFLVDSVLGELSRRGLGVHLLVHPQVRLTRRDGAVQVLEPGADPDPDARTESWMYLEVDRVPGVQEREDLRDSVLTVLDDVDRACRDWGAMRATCADMVEELRAGVPPSVDPATVAPTVEFLTWLQEDHFTFLGYREYDLVQVDGEAALRSVAGSGLGILRDEGRDPTLSRLQPQARAGAHDPRLLTITKANSRSTVHRPVYLDYIATRRFDADGEVVAERRLLGLFTGSAYAESVLRLPIVGDKVREILRTSGFAPDSHSGKDLLGVLEAYPRDELFQADLATLTRTAHEVLHLQERRRAKLFVRPDEFGRFVSALLYIPRDRYTTAVRWRLQALLQEAYGSDTVDYQTRVGESALAQLHFVVRMPRGAAIPEVDVPRLQARMLEATRTWQERLTAVVEAHLDDAAAGDVLAHYAGAFPEAYKEDFGAEAAFVDLNRLAELDATPGRVDLRPALYAPEGAPGRDRRIKLYRRRAVSLTDVLPVFAHLGVEVTDERPYELQGTQGTTYIYDFGLRAPDPSIWAGPTGTEEVSRSFEEAFEVIWSGRAESDTLNALVLTAGLTWREVVILRTLVRYLRQTSSSSLAYLEEALVANPGIAAMVVEVFGVRFDPDRVYADPAERAASADAVLTRIQTALEEVASLDQDRIVRALLSVLAATVRTNYYQVQEDGDPKPHVSLKLLPRRIDLLPEPRPAFEIWVYAPRVEGVHLRFGTVARGGLRWSDRREDFRTEVLGLVKAQLVKNAVIVPTGSKGGFVAKRLPDPAVDREAWLAEGVGAYRIFIKGMLDVTDNRDGSQVLPPDRVVRHDGDDTYLVVAADKGTATFSDIANGVSREYGYWLDDAFASGGSAGYDHKAMGITARGAWESVKRHFREMGLDTQRERFTVVGVGDMSGDVFGNGMLLSEHIALVAAFDHRHIFLDPDPDTAASFAERRRLYDLPRSSWAEYDTALLSPGGGIHSRSAKSVPITPQVRERLGLASDTERLTPAELLRAILLAPVDLLWNGGIGTYVKASTETSEEIGDRANDAIRVDGSQLRVRVVGEGGNLGLSQRGRIEAALAGVHVNTDAIDNSAGVDTSDHEVNIKIALTPLVREGAMDLQRRDALLASMTEDVARRVLRHNYEQNVLIGNARDQGGRMLAVHQRLIRHLGEQVGLDPELEFLPDAAEIERRTATGTGMTSPEFSVLVAYAKLALKEALLASDLPDKPFMASALVTYFPEPLRASIREGLAEHPLRRQIIINEIANAVVNRGGITFVFRAIEETGATAAQIARAFVICREVFDLDGFVAQVEALDTVVDTAVQTELYLEYRRLLDRAVRWFLNNRSLSADMQTEIDRFAGPVRSLVPAMGEMLQGAEHERYVAQASSVQAADVPAGLAQLYAGLLDSFSLLDAVELADGLGREVSEVAHIYFAASEAFGVDALLTQVSSLPRGDRWASLARGAVRDDLYGVMRALTRAVLEATDPGQPAPARVQAWMQDQEEPLRRVGQVLGTVSRLEEPGLAPVSVALRTLRGLVRQGTAG